MTCSQGPWVGFEPVAAAEEPASMERTLYWSSQWSALPRYNAIFLLPLKAGRYTWAQAFFGSNTESVAPTPEQ